MRERGSCVGVLTALTVAGLAGGSPAGMAAQQTSSAHAPDPWTLVRDLEYARPADRPLRLDLYLPAGAGPGPWPVILWFHGQPGHKYPTPARRLTPAGYAVASVEYRSSRAARFPAQILDAKPAVRWLRANAPIHSLDPNRIAAWGESAGGYLAVLLATSAGVASLDSAEAGAPSSRIQAAVNYFGPGRRGAASLLRHVTPDDAPVLIVHGSADRTVSPGRSELLHSTLREAGVESTLEIVSGARHDFTQVHTPRVDTLVRAFLDRHLRAPPTDVPHR
jgi:acetyl esterase/lipase